MFDELPHTYIALNDPIQQDTLFCNMLTYNQEILKQDNPFANS